MDSLEYVSSEHTPFFVKIYHDQSFKGYIIKDKKYYFDDLGYNDYEVCFEVLKDFAEIKNV